MANNTHWKTMYGDIVERLAGYQKRSLLAALFGSANKKGDLVMFDSIEPDDDVTSTAMTSDDKHRMDYEDIAVPELQDWVDLHTPHMDVTKSRTVCSPYKNEFGHTFRDIDEVAENASDHSDVLSLGMSRMMRQTDVQILNALFASTQLRGKDQSALSAVAFPAAQQITNITDGIFDLQVVTTIKKMFEDQYVEDDERIICLLSPAAKKSFTDANPTIKSKDFIDRSSFFAEGKLPDIEGVSFLTHPLVSAYKGNYSDAFVAFTMRAGKLNRFKSIETAMDQAINQRNQWILYICEMIGACRTDDKRVVQGFLGTATS